VTPSHDITHYGSIETGYKNLCSLCFNAEVAKRCGLDEFENIRLEPITMTDDTGQSREFHFVTRLLGNMLSLEAFELQDSVPAGYKLNDEEPKKENPCHANTCRSCQPHCPRNRACPSTFDEFGTGAPRTEATHHD
jgi:hypothetical protein